jgi:hypothetical protein
MLSVKESIGETWTLFVRIVRCVSEMESWYTVFLRHFIVRFVGWVLWVSTLHGTIGHKRYIIRWNAFYFPLPRGQPITILLPCQKWCILHRWKFSSRIWEAWGLCIVHFVHWCTCVTFLRDSMKFACAVEVVKYCHSVQLLGNHPNLLLSLNKKLNFSGLYSNPW